MTEKQKSLEHDELIEREQELREQIEQSKTDDIEKGTEEDSLINYRTYVTSLLKGKVSDIEYHSGKVLLDVRTKEGMLSIPVEDTGEYCEDNELIRLLEWKDIPDGRIGDLLDEDITVRLPTEVLNRDSEINGSECSVYVPRSFDAIGKTVFRTDSILRRIGLTNFEEGVTDCTDVFEKVLGPMLLACLLSIVFTVSMIVSIPVAVLFGDGSALLISILMTVFIGVEIRLGTELARRYRVYRKTDAIQK